jgi:hypothetical protein
VANVFSLQACCISNAVPGDFLAGTAQCSGGYPTAADACSKGCKDFMTPFWARCGEVRTV